MSNNYYNRDRNGCTIEVSQTADPNIHLVRYLAPASGQIRDVRECSCHFEDHEIPTPAPKPNAAQAPLF